MNYNDEIQEKIIKKTNKELLDNHKLILEKFLKVNLNQKRRRRVVFFTLYDLLITEDNIRLFYNKPLRAFIPALINNRLDDIKDLTETSKNTEYKTD